jgi:3'-phosphoadenosine 5'-phosphosulfate sulfotransferase
VEIEMGIKQAGIDITKNQKCDCFFYNYGRVFKKEMKFLMEGGGR